MKGLHLGVVCVLTTTALLLGGCNEHVFQRVLPMQSPSNFVDKKIDIDRAADILFVIDNSGSMAEEQDNLARNVSSSNDPGSRCNAEGFATLMDYLAANPDLSEEEWAPEQRDVFAQCGFIERLQRYNNKFHIGVITTDVNDCDGVYATPERGSVPQRGCLQSSQQEPDLTVLTWETPELATRFANIVRNVGTWGSAYEKGLQAAQHFLTPDHSSPAAGTCHKARACTGDLGDFLRQTEVNAHGDTVETKLVVIFLTDEEDCSDQGRLAEVLGSELVTDSCYVRPDLLVDTAAYVRFFQGLKSRPELVSIAAISGLFDSGSGPRPSGCKLLGGQPTNACDPSRGNSVVTCDDVYNGQPVCPCHTHIDGFDDTNCCQADPAYRYTAVAEAMGADNFALDTICSESYRDTMINIANLLLDVRSVQLSEPVASADDIVVSIRGERWDGEWVDVPRYDVAAGEPASGGWSLEQDNRVIKFWRDWVPEPGDEVQVMYRGL